MVYRDGQGNLQSQILFRDKEADLDLVAGGRKWSFQGSGDQFRLVSEGERIRLTYLFDPFVAVSSSSIDPLPHQISAVYEHMLPRQPMRCLLADDPGAGKTIMAGLLIKELLIRGELERCLIVAPGSLSEQWQDELKPTRKTTFVAFLNLDPMRAGLQMGDFLDEVMSHLQALPGAEVNLSLEIQVTAPQGIDDATARITPENSRSLKAESSRIY